MSPPGRTDVSVPELREWMRNWVANATGQSPDAINETAPLVELGMASRDAVAMASDIEDYTGVDVTATMAFRHPTIESLATVIVEGEPELDDVRRRRGLVTQGRRGRRRHRHRRHRHPLPR